MRNSSSIRGYRTHTNAFSLIEVLAVIAIIVLLAALLIPGLGSARERARTVACLSNLRQINAAITLYSTDMEGQFPPLDYVHNPSSAKDGFFGVLVGAGYINAPVSPSSKTLLTSRTILFCPSGIYELSQPTIKPGDTHARPWNSWDPECHKATAWRQTSFGQDGVVHAWYGVNGSSGGISQRNPFIRIPPDGGGPIALHKRQEVTCPTQLIMVYDGVWAHNNWTINDRISARHYRAPDTNVVAGATNVICFDGHGETVETALMPSPPDTPSVGPRFRM